MSELLTTVFDLLAVLLLVAAAALWVAQYSIPGALAVAAVLLLLASWLVDQRLSRKFRKARR